MKIIPNAYNTSGRLAPQNAESNWRAQISFGEISGARSLPIRDWCDGDKASGAFQGSSIGTDTVAKMTQGSCMQRTFVRGMGAWHALRTA